jgi:ComF family protein
LHCSPFGSKNRRVLGVRRAQVGAVAQYSNALEDCQPSLLRQVYGASKTLIHKLFPATCLLCLDPGQPPSLDLCRECEADLPRTGRGCAICAAPIAAPAIACQACIVRRPAFETAFAPYRYEFPLVELIHRLKYGGQVAIARILGTLLARRLAERGPLAVDAIVPVPLHPSREAKRGYNQAGEIARFAGELLSLPVAGRIALRVRATEEQAALPAIVRRVNVSGAFAVRDVRIPPAVAIVDDVLTTGSTVDALARELKRAGCRRVEVWAVARATGDAGAVAHR